MITKNDHSQKWGFCVETFPGTTGGHPCQKVTPTISPTTKGEHLNLDQEQNLINWGDSEGQNKSPILPCFVLPVLVAYSSWLISEWIFIIFVPTVREECEGL